MMNGSFQSRCPIVREEELKLCQIVDVAGIRQAVPFTATVKYLREGHTHLEYRHGGKLLKPDAAYCDYYGYLSCIESAIEEAERQCGVMGVTVESSLVLSVVLTITEKAVTVLEGPDKYGRTKYQQANNAWMLYEPDQIAAWLQEKDWEKRREIGIPLMLNPEKKVLEHAIWTSKQPSNAADAKVWVESQGF